MEHKDQKNTKRAWWKTGCYMGFICFFIMEGIDYLRYKKMTLAEQIEKETWEGNKVYRYF